MTEPAAARDVLHRVAVHVLARARAGATGRFSLRVAPGGIATPDLPDGRRVRISGDHLVVESDAPGRAAVTSTPIHGSTLAALADAAGADLSQPLDVGHDTPALGDPDAVIELDAGAAREVASCFAAAAAVLDGVLAGLPAGTEATLPRLWPEHFDVAIEVQAAPSRRVNLGVSPGDAFSVEPYLYVGPWTADRPGDPAYWNAPFGAMRTGVDVASGTAFLVDGYRRLA